MKILVVQTAFLGDFIMTLPLIRRLHDANPEARITLAVRPSLATLAADQPCIDEVLPIRKRRGWVSRLGHDLETLRSLRRARFDTVYLPHRSFRSGLYARLTRARTRVGFRGTPASWACTERVRYPRHRHAVERYLALAGPDTLRADEDTPCLQVTPSARRERDDVLVACGVDPGRPYVVLCPGSVWPTKRWTPEGYARVALWFKDNGWTVVLDGAPDEQSLCETVRRLSGDSAVNIAGATSLPVLAATLEGATLLVGNDSGPAHLANAVGTPAVVVYGPTSSGDGMRPPRAWPVERIDLDCRPCGKHGAERCPLGHHACMVDLDADQVMRWIRFRTRRFLSMPREPRAGSA